MFNIIKKIALDLVNQIFNIFDFLKSFALQSIINVKVKLV